MTDVAEALNVDKSRERERRESDTRAKAVFAALVDSLSSVRERAAMFKLRSVKPGRAERERVRERESFTRARERRESD